MHYCKKCIHREVCAATADSFATGYDDYDLENFMIDTKENCEYYENNS